MKTNWKYKWDDEEKNSSGLFFLLFGFLIFVIGGAGIVLLETTKDLMLSLVAVLIGFWLIQTDHELAVLDRLNKLLKRGRK